MLFRKKIRKRLIIVLVVLFVIIYWRGTKTYAEENKLECKRHLVYAVCKQIGQATVVPSLWDVMKAGVRF